MGKRPRTTTDEERQYIKEAWSIIEQNKVSVLNNKMVIPGFGEYKLFTAKDIYKKFKPGCAFCKLFAKDTPIGPQWDVFSTCLKKNTESDDKCNDEYMNVFAPKLFEVNHKSSYYAIRSALIQGVPAPALIELHLRAKKIEAFNEIRNKNDTH